jgi:hypothetical protein
MRTPRENEFMFEGNPVGFFEGPQAPRFAGLYRYMPYRGYGHLRMVTEVSRGRSPRCYFDATGKRTWFTVKALPEKRLLELQDFEQVELTGSDLSKGTKS